MLSCSFFSVFRVILFLVPSTALGRWAGLIRPFSSQRLFLAFFPSLAKPLPIFFLDHDAAGSSSAAASPV
jgi:hypothetical protein